MNLRPSGYEPDELPDCSTPHQERNYGDTVAKMQPSPGDLRGFKRLPLMRARRIQPRRRPSDTMP